MLQFVIDLLPEEDIDSGKVRVGLMTFSTSAAVEFHLFRYSTYSQMVGAIRAIPYITGDLNIANALWKMRTTMFVEDSGDRPDIPDIVVVITAGESVADTWRNIPEADLVKQQGMTVYTVGIGESGAQDLNDIASTPLEYYSYKVDGFPYLTDIKNQLFWSVNCGKFAYILAFLSHLRLCKRTESRYCMFISFIRFFFRQFFSHHNFCRHRVYK